jgi:hypothetical protein
VRPGRARRRKERIDVASSRADRGRRACSCGRREKRSQASVARRVCPQVRTEDMAERVALDSSASDECLIAVRDSHTGSFNDAASGHRYIAAPPT